VALDISTSLTAALPSVGNWSCEQAFAGSSHGAELWRDDTNRRIIVKQHPGASVSELESVARRVKRLRAAGVPAPDTTVARHGAGALLIHDYLPGVADPALNSSLLDDLIRVVELEAGLADGSATEWADLIHTSLTVGLAGYQEHRSLSTFSDASRELLHRIRAVGEDPVVSRLPAADLVHYDLHTRNVVSDDGHRVSGVIDWDGVRPGDRSFDLAVCAFTSMWKTASSDLHEHIWNAFLSSSTHDARVVYMHLVALRQADWVIRHPGLAPGPERTIATATWALGVTERGRFAPIAV
jgi:aminoglycoside phosphotransferase